MARPLRSGFTTGTCAAAAVKGAALLLRDGIRPTVITLTLPCGEQARFTPSTASHKNGNATCSITKDAGDDPDVTNGAELTATLTPAPGSDITIAGGSGIGKVTKPGLAVAVGEWAINPIPRRMIEQAVREIYPAGGWLVTISIPDGEARAKKTLNARLGIIGGLSILGTTGIVRPISIQAWTDTIDTALDVARAVHCPTVVLATGRTSELAAMRHHANLPEEAFIMMGDHVAHALQSCQRHGFTQPMLACQFAKLVKIACGHANTHAVASQLDLAQLTRWLRAAAVPDDLIRRAATANTARELVLASDYSPLLLQTVCDRLLIAIRQHAPGLTPTILISRYDGKNAIPYPSRSR